LRPWAILDGAVSIVFLADRALGSGGRPRGRRLLGPRARAREGPGAGAGRSTIL